MGVNVDEARRQRQPDACDLAGRPGRAQVAEAGDSIAGDREIAEPGHPTAAVQEQGAPDDQIGV